VRAEILPSRRDEGKASSHRRDPDQRLLELKRESDKRSRRLQWSGTPSCISLAERLEKCAEGAWVWRNHSRFGSHIRKGNPCYEAVCPICCDRRRRQAYSEGLSAFRSLFLQDPHLKFCLITLTAPPLYGDLPDLKQRVAKFLKAMNFQGTVKGFHMTCGQEGAPQAHCHIIAFYHGDPPSEAKCCEVWAGRVHVKMYSDNSPEMAANLFSYLHRAYQVSSKEDVAKLPELAKVMKEELRVSKAGLSLKRAFSQPKAGRVVPSS
jgi:hypothetical protein